MSGVRALACLTSLSGLTPAFRGKTRLQRLATRALAGGRIVAVEIDGVSWQLDAAEHIQQRILWDGLHDAHLVGWLVGQLAPGTRTSLWDIGANVGAITLPVAARVATVRIEAFEPAAGPRALLENNLAANPGSAPRVRVHALALSNTSGAVSFFESAERENAGLGTLYPATNTQRSAVTVASERGDELVASGRAAGPDIIKIDVEGFELEVLEGLARTIATRRPLLCVESAGYRLAERGLPRDAVIRALERLGYRVSVIAPGRRGEERAWCAADLVDNVDLAAHPL